MSKIDIIDYCGDCSKRYYDGNTMRCELTDLETHENNPIPAWCKLDDAARASNITKWIEVKDRLPDDDERVLTISPVYDQPENRYRLMDGQFVRICKDVTKWISVKELEGE